MWRRNYDHIKEQIKQNNAVCVYDLTIAGEGFSGIFAIGFFINQLRTHIVNDTFHPYLYRYVCGASIGTFVIECLLKIWFIYDTQPDKQIALDMIEAYEKLFDFQMLRGIITTVDNTDINNTLALSNIYKILLNFFLDGGLFTRLGIRRFLRMDYSSFDRFRPYFDTSDFFEWREPKLNNVFLSVQSIETSVSCIFTGNDRMFKTESKLIQFKKLTNTNFDHILLCSSGIPIVFEPLNIDGVNSTADGAMIIRNLMHIPQILHNFSYYNNVEDVFSPLLNYFDICSNDFIIHNDVINIQTYFETVPEFGQIFNKALNAIYTVINIPLRQIKTASENYELSSIAYTQPIIKEFSTCDANEIKGISYEYSASVLNHPDNIAKVLDVKNDIPVNLNDYSLIISSLPLSSYIYDSRSFTHRGINIRLVDTNTFVRTLYKLPNAYTILYVPLNIDTPENQVYIRLLFGTGIIQSNVMYDIYNKRMSMDWTQLSGVIQKSYDDFLGDRIYG